MKSIDATRSSRGRDLGRIASGLLPTRFRIHYQLDEVFVGRNRDVLRVLAQIKVVRLRGEVRGRALAS